MARLHIHFLDTLYAWATTSFVQGIYDHVDKSSSRLVVQRYVGTLNTYQSSEINAINYRELLRGNIDSKDFCWNPFPSSSHFSV